MGIVLIDEVSIEFQVATPLLLLVIILDVISVVVTNDG
jgi:hypothetical protein